MADALDLGSSVQYVWVQVPHPAPNCTKVQNLPTWSVMHMKVSTNFKSEDSPIG